MGDNLWTDKIPSEILARVFSFLPIPSILQLRSVCKSWNSIISSNTFPMLWSRYCSPHPPWIIMYQSRDSIAAFSPSSAKWYTISVPFPPGLTHRRILASAGGLLCFGSFCDACRLLVVCNPMSKQWRVLPEVPLEGEKFLIGMFVDKLHGCYKIYLTDEVNGDTPFARDNIEAIVYSSLEDRWRPLHLKEKLLLEGCQRHCSVWSQGTFFSVSKAGPPHELMTYNILEEDWSSMQLPFECSMSLTPPLSARKGRLFLAGGMWEHLPFSSFNIWELDRASWKFIEVDCTFSAAFEEGFSSPVPSQTLQRLQAGDLLFFHARLLLCPLLYDLLEKSWHCLPRYYGPCEGWVPGFTYEPSFVAEV